jgi:hypothetical protein
VLSMAKVPPSSRDKRSDVTGRAAQSPSPKQSLASIRPTPPNPPHPTLILSPLRISEQGKGASQAARNCSGNGSVRADFRADIAVPKTTDSPTSVPEDPRRNARYHNDFARSTFRTGRQGVADSAPGCLKLQLSSRADSPGSQQARATGRGEGACRSRPPPKGRPLSFPKPH